MALVVPMPGAAEENIAMQMAPPSRLGDRAFEWLTAGMAMAVLALVILVGWQLARESLEPIRKFGFHFLATSTWDPVSGQFGALPFIYGTLVSSLIALITPDLPAPVRWTAGWRASAGARRRRAHPERRTRCPPPPS